MIRPRNSTKRSLPPGTRERFTMYSCTVGQALKTDVDLRMSVTKQIHVGCPVAWYDYQTCADPPLSLFQLKCSNKYCYDRFYCITWLKPVPTTPIAPRISSATLTCTPAERVWEGATTRGSLALTTCARMESARSASVPDTTNVPGIRLGNARLLTARITKLRGTRDMTTNESRLRLCWEWERAQRSHENEWYASYGVIMFLCLHRSRAHLVLAHGRKGTFVRVTCGYLEASGIDWKFNKLASIFHASLLVLIILS